VRRKGEKPWRSGPCSPCFSSSPPSQNWNSPPHGGSRCATAPPALVCSAAQRASNWRVGIGLPQKGKATKMLYHRTTQPPWSRARTGGPSPTIFNVLAQTRQTDRQVRSVKLVSCITEHCRLFSVAFCNWLRLLGLDWAGIVKERRGATRPSFFFF